MLSLASLLSTVVEVVLFPVLLAFTAAKTLVQYVARGCKPLYPKWTLSFELTRALTRFISERYGESLPLESISGRMRRVTEALGSVAGKASCKKHHSVFEPEIANGLEHLWLKSCEKSDGDSQRFVVIYYHGGGFALDSPRVAIDCCNSLRSGIVSELRAASPSKAAHSVQLDFFIANYRKTPVHKLPIPQQDALLAYEYLVAHHKISPSNIIVMGDSAGGGLALSTLLGLRDSNKSHLLPLAGVLICGYVDYTAPAQDAVQPPHCVLSQPLMNGFRKAALANPDDQAEARELSPLYADLRGLPPVLIQGATLDFLYKNTLDLVAKAKADGVLEDWEVDIHEGVPHVFTILSQARLPYAAVGVQKIGEFVVRTIEAGINDRAGDARK
ncbi:hypothetical protein Gpo141_00010971 [Globisporangium polare]